MKKSLTPYRVAISSAVCAALFGVASSAAAIDLTQAYHAALINDPAYRMAAHELEAGRENKIIGRAALLPQVAVSASYNENKSDLLSADFLGRPTLTHPDYTSKSQTLTLRQPLINLDGVARYKRGVAQSKFAEVQFEARRQDLIIRLVTAYVEALYSDDLVALATAQRDMYIEQKKVNDRLFKQGEGTKTDSLETQAQLDVAEAALLEARDGQVNSRNALQGIVGIDLGRLAPLAPEFDKAALAIGTFEDWKSMALSTNAELRAQIQAIEIARQEYNQAKAGHYPRLDMVASYGKALSETLTTRGQESTSRSIGFQLNVPLYSGGQVNALSRQAAANRSKAEAELTARSDKVLVELRKQYNTLVSARARVTALLAARESGSLLMEATRQSIKGGIRINLDLLNAQQLQYTTLRDLSSARYNYLLAFMRLRLAAGTLSGEDVELAGRYFR